MHPLRALLETVLVETSITGLEMAHWDCELTLLLGYAVVLLNALDKSASSAKITLMSLFSVIV